MGLDTTFYKIKKIEENKYFRNNYDLIHSIYYSLKNSIKWNYEDYSSVLVDDFLCNEMIKYLEEHDPEHEDEKIQEALNYIRKELLPMFDKDRTTKLIVTTV